MQTMVRAAREIRPGWNGIEPKGYRRHGAALVVAGLPFCSWLDDGVSFFGLVWTGEE